jgi:hypothetical protein
LPFWVTAAAKFEPAAMNVIGWFSESSLKYTCTGNLCLCSTFPRLEVRNEVPKCRASITPGQQISFIVEGHAEIVTSSYHPDTFVEDVKVGLAEERILETSWVFPFLNCLIC